MKYFAIFTLLLVALFHSGSCTFKDELKEKTKACADEMGITESQITEWEKNGEAMSDEDKQKGGNLSACMLRKLDLMEGNTLKIDAMLEKVRELNADDPEKKTKMEEAINACKDTVNSEMEDWVMAGMFTKCMTDRTKDFYSDEKAAE